MLCAFLPWVISSVATRLQRARLLAIFAATITLAWLVLAVANIRVTIPLWSDGAKLWLWVLQENPNDYRAMNSLLTTYVERHDMVNARKVANVLFARKPNCPACMVNIANIALVDGNLDRASEALRLAGKTTLTPQNRRLMQTYVLASGQLLEERGDSQGAEATYRRAIKMQPLDPQAQMNLALLMAREGRVGEARRQAEKAIALFAPPERPYRRQEFEHTLSAATHAAPQKPDTTGH